MKNSIRLLLIFACAAWSSAGSTLLALELPRKVPFEVEWPQNWESGQLPLRSESQDGGKVRGLKRRGDQAVAAIEITFIPRKDQGKAELDSEFNTALSAIQQGYAKAGLSAEVSHARSSVLGHQPALDADISVAGADATLRQWLGMAFSPRYVYSVTFTAQEPEYKKLRGEFEQVLASLQLE